MSDYSSHLERISTSAGNGRLLVHSDMFRVRSAVRECKTVDHMLATHIELLGSIVPFDRLLFPTFNYDFLRTGIYNVAHDCSQVGPLSEFARSNWSQWRSYVPVFNVCGIGVINKDTDGYCEIDPFGHDSIFADLYVEEGDLLFYGSEFASATAIHYVERKSGGPVYRYDKRFLGTVINGDNCETVSLNYHCRPRGRTLEYDFHKIETLLTAEGLINSIDLPGFTVKLVKYSAMVDLLSWKISEDRLFLLDDSSARWVADKLDVLGRRFNVTDFEADTL